jgi:hypothetical protein
MGLGWEHVRDARLVEEAPRWAEEAVQKLSARPVEPGAYDLVLLPSHLWLTIHESIAHPTELDRIMGFEANYAGTSFIHPLEDYLGTFRYGPEFMNIQGERSSPGGLASVGYDDDGVRPRDYLIVQERRPARPADDARAGAVARRLVRPNRRGRAQPRQQLRAELGGRPVPAHAEREPAPAP